VTSFPAAGIAGAPGFTNAALAATIWSGTVSLDMSMVGMNSPMGCSAASNYRLPVSVQNFNTTASAIITGFAGSKHLVFYVSGCDTDGSNLISGVVVQSQ